MDESPSIVDPTPALAVVGFAFEFPNEATSPEGFWEMIQEGRSASRDFPKDRLNIDAYYHPDSNRPSTLPVRGGHFVTENLAAFDAPFFAISAGEASCMDPQHRRLLEVSYHALEDAGIPIDQCAGSDTSVYTGCFTNDYLSILQQDLESEQRHAIMGVAPSMLANRISWFFDFKGTSMNLDSACSSSLVALHFGCQDLITRSCSMALVGGANLLYHPHFMKMMTDFSFLSNDSQSWSFDSRANGYARGEGHAVLVIKRLHDALRDGNTIRAVIRNTGTNQDGRTPGITQPNGNAQVELIRRTYEQARIDMEPTRFFEAHGTGTPVGDPIEANAIGAAFQHCRSQTDPLYIGAVKANIGHLEGCSGLAGVIKTILVLEKGIIPPIAGFKSLNQRIDAESLNLRFPRKALAWPVQSIRRACVNSFGFGGTNATVILDDAYGYFSTHNLAGFHRTCVVNRDPQYNNAEAVGLYRQPENAVINTQKTRLFVWSAADSATLQTLSELYWEYLCRNDINWDDLAFTLSKRRSQFLWRSFHVAGTDHSIPTKNLNLVQPTKASPGEVHVAFVFTGQGAQYPGMGGKLMLFPAFSDSINASEGYLRALGCPWSLVQAIQSSDEEHLMRGPEYSQPAILCLEIALIELFKSFNILPSVVLGHSSGEIAAAYACGALSHAAAVNVAYKRGVLSARLVLASNTDELTMLAVGLAKDAVQPYLSRLCTHGFATSDVEVGCVNSPKSITLSGRWIALSKIQKWLEQDGHFARKLYVSMAYHSSFITPIAEEYLEALQTDMQPGNHRSIPMISSVTGDIIDHALLRQGDYWVRNMTSTVEFASAISKMFYLGRKKPKHRLGRACLIDNPVVTHALEIGPHNALQGPIRECLEYLGTTGSRFTYIPSLSRGRDASLAVAEAAGLLYSAGFPVNLMRVNGLEETNRPVPPDLPAYPFNHSQNYWKEGRLSRNLRFPQVPRHDLLGLRCLDWNPQVAQWRNVLRISDLPWLQDHRIADQVVFPAAGMIVMAIEAAKEVQGLGQELLGLYLQDIRFSHAIVFPPETQHIETQFTLIGSGTMTMSKSTSSSQFKLFLMENGSYIECCTGTIEPVINQHERDRIVSWDASFGSEGTDRWRKRVIAACNSTAYDIYADQNLSGINYGPCFRGVKDLRLGAKGEASAKIDTGPRVLTSGNGELKPTYTIHPAALDCLAQLIVPALTYNCQDEGLPTMMPVSVRRFWIDCCSPELQQGAFAAAGHCQVRGHRGAGADIIATAGDTNVARIIMTGIETAYIDSSSEGENQRSKNVSRQMCHSIVHRPDITLMSSKTLLAYCIQGRPEQSPESIVRYEDIRKVLACIMEDTLQFIDANGIPSQEDHLRFYSQWMTHQLRLMGRRQPVDHSDAILISTNSHRLNEEQMRKIEDSSEEGRLLMTISRNLRGILSGAVNPLTIIFEHGLVNRYYEEMLANDHHSYPISRYMDLAAFKNPSMKILEVGAGTGAITSKVLEAMTQNGTMKWAYYDYTDLSSGFFDTAHAKFQKYARRMRFKTYDISLDPEPQGLELGSYDLIIASHTLHALCNLEESLTNLRKLLIPGGILMLLETTYPDALQIGFIFGVLKDWWKPFCQEPRSTFSPCLTTEQWNDRLKRAGFSGVDVDIPGQTDALSRYSSIIISCAVSPRPEVAPAEIPDIHVIANLQIPAQHDIFAITQSQWQTWSCQGFASADIVVSSNTITVVLLELDDIFLDSISKTNFIALQTALVRSKRVLWVSRSIKDRHDPRYRLVDGLGRVLMSENPLFKFTSLYIGDFNLSTADIIAMIFEASRALCQDSVECIETDWTYSNGYFLISRVVENPSMDMVVAQATSTHKVQMCQLDGDTRLELVSTKVGQIAWQERVHGSELNYNVQDKDLLVQVHAIGLTRKDCFVIQGQLYEPDIGSEFSGEVLKAGPDSGFQVGDSVLGISPITSGNRLELSSTSVVLIPPHVTLIEAASMPTSLWLAYHGLVNLARLEPEEIILVHQGTSCVGQMAVQIAQRLGARVLVTTSSIAKSQFLGRTYNIDSSNLLLHGDGVLVNKILNLTDGRGVDVVFGALTEDECDTEFDHCLASMGRLIDTSLRPRSKAGASSSVANITKTHIRMHEMLRTRPTVAYDILRYGIRFASKHQLIPPQTLHVFQASRLKEAFASFAGGEFGKRIIQLRAEAEVSATILTKPQTSFSPAGSYLIAGGFGGIGRSFAQWMAARGVCYLIILSRTGARTTKAIELVEQLNTLGVTVACPAVDISDLQALQQTVERLMKSMPPIRGCIQATLALRDNFWPNMSFDDWHESTNSKVTGSWNLNTVLPSGMDFFILISSVNGIFGSRGQANYAAGNAFKDALARYRVARGEKAISIDLGLMVDEGRVAEDEALLAQIRRVGHLMDLCMDELLALTEYYCSPNLPLLSHDESQILVGIELPSAVLAKGIDLHHSIHRPIFRHLFAIDRGNTDRAYQSGGSASSKSIEYATLLRKAQSDEEAAALATTWLKTRISQMVGRPLVDINIQLPAHSYGIDSLVAIDLRNWLLREVGADVQIFLLLGNLSLQELGREAARLSRLHKTDKRA